MSVTVTRAASIHTGGTKFYQTFVVTSDMLASNSFVLFHWGGLTDGTKWQNPSWGGQTSGMVQLDGHDCARRQQIHKQRPKGGHSYKTWSEETKSFTYRAEFESWLRATIPTKYHSMLIPIGDDAFMFYADKLDSTTTIAPLVAKPLSVDTPEPEPTQPEWGSW